MCGWCLIAGKCVADEEGPCLYPENHVSLRGVGGSNSCPADGEDPAQFWYSQGSPLQVVGVEDTIWSDEKLDAALRKLADEGSIAVSREALVSYFKEHVPNQFKQHEEELVGPGRAELKKRLLQVEVDRHTAAVPRILTQFAIAGAVDEMCLYLQEMFGAFPEKMAPTPRKKEGIRDAASKTKKEKELE